MSGNPTYQALPERFNTVATYLRNFRSLSVRATKPVDQRSRNASVTLQNALSDEPTSPETRHPRKWQQ
jgi:hypothetical protein